jgi:hypothetical protein
MTLPLISVHMALSFETGSSVSPSQGMQEESLQVAMDSSITVQLAS